GRDTGAANPETGASRPDTGTTLFDTGVLVACCDDLDAIELTSTTMLAHQNVCSAAQIAAFNTACLSAAATAATCNAFTMNTINKGCTSCLSGGPLGDGGVNNALP